MKIHLIDGTYELFRSYFAIPPIAAPDGRVVGAVRGLLQTLLVLLRREQVTHVAVAFDHVLESFRNGLFAGYKTGGGIPEDLRAQFGLAERAISAMGIVVWPMVEYEADDAIATATSRWADALEVDQIVICSPDKDFTQLVKNDGVVCLDRRTNRTINETGVWDKFGVAPESIPDYLALVGDSADGIPGIPRWGAKGSAQILSHYRHIENIPCDPSIWSVRPRGAIAMGASLTDRWEEVVLYKELTTLRQDVPLTETLSDLQWLGARRRDYEALCTELGFTRLLRLPHKWASS